MEISEKQLLQLANEVDDLNREGMETMGSDIRELHAEMRGFRRRSLLKGAGIGGAAITIGSAISPLGRLVPVGAQGLSAGDAGIAAYAESVELAAVAAYGIAADSGQLSRAVVRVATMFAEHHQAHAEAFGGAAGSAASGEPNAALLAALGPDLEAAVAAGEASILEFAIGVENAAASTYLFALGALESPVALQLTASILPVESQHAVVLGMAIGKDVPDLVPSFETQDAALNPADFPIS